MWYVAPQWPVSSWAVNYKALLWLHFSAHTFLTPSSTSSPKYFKAQFKASFQWPLVALHTTLNLCGTQGPYSFPL